MMSRHFTLHTAAIVLILSLVAPLDIARATTDEHGGSERPPNIIFIMADDLGWAELGSYGQTKIRTPNLDRLAARGVRFTQFYSGSPVCAPSRCVLMTGKHSGHAYVRDNREMGGWGPDEPEGQLPLPPEQVTVGELLQKAGYVTGVIGKWGLGGPDSTGEPNRQGFDHWFGYLCQRVAHNYYPTHLWRNGEKVPLEGNTWGNLTGAQYSADLMIDEAIDFINDHQAESFFLYYATPVPHLALQVPEDSLKDYEGDWDDPAYDGKKGYLPHPSPRAAYAAMITRMDEHIGRMVATIEELGLSGDTVFMFTSDNGATYDIGGAHSEFFESAGPLRGRKGSVWEGGIRVPLIACQPGRIEGGRVSDHLGAFQDVLPTLLDLAQAPELIPPDTDGVSFAPTLLDDREQVKHEYLYFEFAGYGGQQALRYGDWKAVRRDIRKGNTGIQLFNLANDLGEQEDVADSHPEIVDRILRFMRESHTPSEQFSLPAIDQ